MKPTDHLCPKFLIQSQEKTNLDPKVSSAQKTPAIISARGACWDASVVRIRGSEGSGSSGHRLGRCHLVCCLSQRARELFPLPSPQLLFGVNLPR